MDGREKGYKLEQYVADSLKEFDTSARPTNGSGAGGERGDIYTKTLPFIIECKFRSIKNLVINSEWWRHLLNRLPHGSPRRPVLVVANDEIKYAVMEFDTYCDLLREAGYSNVNK